MTDAVVILTTVPSAEVGDRIALALVGERLAACVNVLPAMVSVYRWKGAVQSDAEQQLIIKTVRGRLHAVRARLSVLHPYELAECLVLPVDDGDPDYLAWMAAETSEASG